MRKDRFKKRGMALGLAGVMLFSTLTGTTVNATWSDNPEEKPDAVRYGLWMGDSWYGEYRYDEETDTPMEDWLVSEDTAYSAEEVNIEDMYDYTNDIDIRAVNGTWKNAYYFSYVSYTKAEDGSIAETEEPKQITDASELVITYLGAELDNPERRPEVKQHLSLFLLQLRAVTGLHMRLPKLLTMP